MAVEGFAAAFPDRFFNVGVAEQNLIGLATGLADSGFIPFVYSITPFAVLRPFEFIRNGPILHQLQVRVVGIGGGVDYGANGPSHHALEDLGVMRMQPGMTVLAPADGEQAAAMLESTWDLPGPIYYRVGKNEVPALEGLSGRFRLGRAEQIRRGRDVLLISSGAIAGSVVEAAAELGRGGVDCEVLLVSSLRPAPLEDIAEGLGRHRLAFTVESHYTVGGLGSLVAEISAEAASPCRVIRCGFDTMPGSLSGGQSYLEDLHGLSPRRLVARILARVEQDRSPISDLAPAHHRSPN